MDRVDLTAYSTIARLYEPNNREHFSTLVKSAGEMLRGLQDKSEIVSHYAVIACGLAVGIRVHTGVDLCTVSFPPESPPIHSAHPVSKTIPILDLIIKSQLEWLGSLDPKERKFVDIAAKLHTSLIWKAYMFALNTEPSEWGADALHAMNSLRILSTADPSEVVGANKRDARDEGVRRTIQQNDWPPAGYIKLYFANRQLLVYKNKMLLGIESPPSFR